MTTSNTSATPKFSDWYNSGGFESAPWIEILDLNKWLVSDDDDDDDDDDEYVEEGEDSNEESTTNDKIVSFEFPLPRSNESLKVSINRADMSLLKRVTTRTLLINRTPEEVAGLLMEASDDEGILTKQVRGKNVCHECVCVM